ncbi:MAG TPA: MBL fold metallo-hydrolase [Acidimicrobiales bacterium]|nr:MBL fold metallo-hydrolase [Acidimicrobiales bacterium]
MRVGDITIDPVLDGVARIEASAAYRGVGGVAGSRGGNPEDWSAHLDLLDADGRLELALGGFLVRTGDRVVLVDTGVGDLERGPMKGGRFLLELEALGIRPEQVTDVLLTHLHFDHVGWSTHHGEVVFQNATYRCDRRDWEHFVGPDPGATKKLSPLEGQLEPWTASGPVLPGIDTMSAPGHTPGSTIIVVSSGTDRAMLLGDVVHCPVELLDDEWGGMSDVDPELARRTRVALARELEGSDIPVAAAHFNGLQFGRLLTGSGKRSWVLSNPVA